MVFALLLASLVSVLSDAERGLSGLWHAPDPYPERLDSKTRYRIGGLEGLSRFSAEAMASEGAQFALLDLRVDKSFRSGSQQGTWQRQGSTIRLSVGSKDNYVTISSDGQKLLAGGRTACLRG